MIDNLFFLLFLLPNIIIDKYLGTKSIGLDFTADS